MRFVIFVFVLFFANVSYGQFQTVPVDTLETIEIKNLVFAQVDVCEYCSLIPISYEMESHIVSEKQKLFNRERGRLRELISRLFGRNRREARGMGCGG